MINFLRLSIISFAIMTSTSLLAQEEVSVISDPAYYSAGKMTSAEIEEALNEEIKPELFDIWLGKKERIYLNGSWKLIKLANSANLANCDFGEKKGFQNLKFDDSSWFNQPVPYFWDNNFQIFPENGKGRSKVKLFAGTGWYRKKFTVPAKFKDQRIVLCFLSIGGRNCEVFVNGHEVASHRNFRMPRSGLMNNREEGFEVDITDQLDFSGENLIAVKIFEPATDPRTPAKSVQWMRHFGGIWQEVYLEARPSTYLKKALITPCLKDSKLNVKAFINNNAPKNVTIKPTVILKPWSSTRYSLAKGTEEQIQIPELTLKPGENTVNFSVPIKKPQEWSPEHPFLYHFILKDQKGTILGQERFGFREFTCAERTFLLNGKETNLRGQQGVWGTGAFGHKKLIYQLGYLNRKQLIENWFKSYLGMNLNMTRTHSSWYPHSFYEIADETGTLIYDEDHFYLNAKEDGKFLFFDGKDITPLLKEKVKDRVHAAYNYPSIVLRSLGNEKYDQHFYDTNYGGGQMPPGMNSYAPFMKKFYEEYKKLDPTRPVTGSSGRLPTEKSLDKVGANCWAVTKEYAYSDFHDAHNYQMCWEDIPFAEEDKWRFSYKKYFDAYALDDGKMKPVINGETNISYLFPVKLWKIRGACLQAEFRPHIKNGKLDREWLVKEWQAFKAPIDLKTPPKFQKHPSIEYLKKKTLYERAMRRYGFLPMIENPGLLQAEFYRRLIEQHRRKRKYCAGFISNCPMTFLRSSGGEPFEPVYSYVKKACQPILACVSEKFNRNLFSGLDNPENNFFIINDAEETLNDVTVKLNLSEIGEGGKKAELTPIKIASLKTGQMEVISRKLNLPGDLPNGHYRLTLEVYAKDQKRSSNDYVIYVLNSKSVKLSPSPKNAKIAVLQSSSDELGSKESYEKLSSVLNKLKIPFSTIKKLDEIADHKLLILPPLSCKSEMKADKFVDWLSKGGKVLAFEQSALPPGIPGRIQRTGHFGYFTELLEWDHPIFHGLNQNDFELWNGDSSNIKNKWLMDRCMLPLNTGALAILPTIGQKIGCSAAEFKIGEGLCLFSQLKALERFEKDSVATKYTLNLLKYATGPWKGENAPLLKETEKKQPGFTLNKNKTFFVDLKKHANMAFADEVAFDEKGGFTDQGPEIDLKRLPTGLQIFNGVPFNIINPDDNKGKSCLVLRGNTVKSKTNFLPNVIENIKIDKKVKDLYFLLNAAWITDQAKVLGKIRIVYYTQGTGMFGTVEIDLINGENIAGWWNPKARKTTSAKIAWIGMTGEKRLTEVGLYLFKWTNPDTNRKIERISFISNEQAVLAITAVTGEEL